MKEAEGSKVSLFLMEMVVALLFFSICSAICIKVFATAQDYTAYSRNLSSASSLCQSAAEVYKACGGDIEKAAAILDGVYQMEQAKVYYDSNWNIAEDQHKGKFVILIEDKGVEGFVRSSHIYAKKINGNDAQETIFSLNIKVLEDMK